MNQQNYNPSGAPYPQTTPVGDIDVPSQRKFTQAIPPYPTVPYPGFSNYNTVNSSTDSLGKRLASREEAYKKDKPINNIQNYQINHQQQQQPPQQQQQQQQRLRSMESFDSYPARASAQNTPANYRNNSLQSYESLHSTSTSGSFPHNEGIVPNPPPHPQAQPNSKSVNGISQDLQNVHISEPNVTPQDIRLVNFTKIKEISIKDYQQGKFDPHIQLDWVKKLLEVTADRDFLGKYNINGEFLNRELSSSEIKKNEHIFIKQAIKLLKKINSDSKFPEAQFLLGTLYSNSPTIKLARPNILEKNYEKSFDCYSKAAQQGHILATYRLAVSYELGIGTNLNEKLAFENFTNAAQAGSVPSMFKLGLIFSTGSLNSKRSANHSIYWFKKASELASVDNPHALFELGKVHERDFPFLKNEQTMTKSDLQYLQELDSLGITKNDDVSLNYYKEAAKLLYPPAQYKLGWCYEFGKLNCVIDAKKSIGWYSRSARQGYSTAEMALSGWYLTGAKGVLEPSDKEAFLWASKSAESGFVKAEYALGYFYEVGLGCDVDLQKSRKFYLRAATQGHSKAIEKLKKV